MAVTARHRAVRAEDVPPGMHGRSFRPDVQGLRAVAVLLVVIYHLYPARLSGGYIGVDVFFVISGFLITGHLASGLAKTGKIHLLDFWGRRARRLLPAAAVVLLATWLVARVVLPATQLPATAEQIRASALYYQNWTLSNAATNYLTADDAPTPVQHFWSLSVEEQFYLIWPFLFVLGAIVVWRWRQRIGRAVVLSLASGVVVASLVYSAHETAANPPAAYFITTTRIWELAAGGVLALAPRQLLKIVERQGWLAWIGLAMIVYSAVTMNAQTAFPGTIATLPVGGALLVIACGSRDARWGPAWLTSLRPAVFIGDISYSLYLWHWPMIVLWLAYSGGKIGPLDGPAILVAAIVVSWLTKVLVEDPVRLSPFITKSPRRSLATALAVLVPVGIVAALYTPPPVYHIHLDKQHPGAAVLAGDVKDLDPAPVEPSIVDAPTDMVDDTACQAPIPQTTPRPCVTGEKAHPTLRVALIGDSVAGQWRRNLEIIAAREHWTLIVDLHAECPWTATMVAEWHDSKPYTACQQWGATTLHDMLTKYRPDVVITSARPVLGTPSHPARDATSFGQIADGMVSYWRQLVAAGTKVVAIRESPEAGMNVPDCLSTPGASPRDCTIPADKAVIKDTPLEQAAAAMAGDGVELVNMNDLICGKQVCDPIIGNVAVYRDSHHLTLTYSRTLLPNFERRLLATKALTPPSP